MINIIFFQKPLIYILHFSSGRQLKIEIYGTRSSGYIPIVDITACIKVMKVNYPLLLVHFIKPLQHCQVVWIVYHPSPKSDYSVLQESPMYAYFHIWVSVYVVLTSTWDKHFQYLDLMAVHRNIEATTVARNKNFLSRVYLLHTSIHLVFVVIIFVCFQLCIVYPLFFFRTLQTCISCHQ